MLNAICAHLHNYFCDPADVCAGTFTIQGGTIDLSDILIEHQYFRLVGSTLNDGVYRYPVAPPEEGEDPVLLDETFTGEIWPMKVPRALVNLAAEIEAWQQQYGATMASPLQSENVIGVYSYTKDGSGSGGGASTADAWKSVFKNRLNEWRKLR